MATVTIKNNNPRVETVAYAYLATTSGGTKGLNFRLVPGNNEIDAEAWAKAMKLKIVKANVESGAWVEVGGAMSESQEKQSIALIEDTLDRALLGKWKQAEKRPAVLAAIQAQLDKTDPAKKDAEPGSDGIDLAPRQNASSFDGEAIAAQVTVFADQEAKPKAKSTAGGKRR